MHSQDFLKDCLFKEIDLVQDTIKRMASSSFLIKGWTITLVLVTLLIKGSKYHVFISFIPLLVFWYLDAYFLQRENMYCKLYDWVLANRLKTEEFLFNMDANRFKKEVNNIVETMFSVTLGWFYGVIFILVFAYSLFLLLSKGGC